MTLFKKKRNHVASRLGEGRLRGKDKTGILDSKTRKIYMNFLNSSPKDIVTLSEAAFLRSFFKWLKESGYIITTAKSKS